MKNEIIEIESKKYKNKVIDAYKQYADLLITKLEYLRILKQIKYEYEETISRNIDYS